MPPKRAKYTATLSYKIEVSSDDPATFMALTPAVLQEHAAPTVIERPNQVIIHEEIRVKNSSAVQVGNNNALCSSSTGGSDSSNQPQVVIREADKVLVYSKKELDNCNGIQIGENNRMKIEKVTLQEDACVMTCCELDMDPEREDDIVGGRPAWRPTEEVVGEINEEELLWNLDTALDTATGVKKTDKFMQKQGYAADNMEAWNDQKVYVGIVGDIGAGKNTFINSIRGLRPKDTGAAEVGLGHTKEVKNLLGHTTSEVVEYPHPARPESLIFVNFPGVLLKKGSGGVRDFDIQDYLNEYGRKMDQCHVFLVFSSGRIQHNAVQIAMKARDKGKTVLFVRSKFDQDLYVQRIDDPDYFVDNTEADLMEQLRQDYIRVLKDVGWEGEVNPRDVFIISGRLTNVLVGSWDIPKLRKAMIEGLSAHQKMVVINTCRDFSKNTIKERGDIYRSYVWSIATAATAGSLVPYAGAASIPDAIDFAYKQYKEGFGLTEDAVEQLAKMTNKSSEDLQQFLSTNLLAGTKRSVGGSEALAVVQAICSELGMATAIAVDQRADLVFPVIGALLTAPLAFGVTTKVLHALISHMEKYAIDLFDYAFEESPM